MKSAVSLAESTRTTLRSAARRGPRRAPAARVLVSLGSIAASGVVYAALGDDARGPVLQFVSFVSFTGVVLGAPFALALAAFAMADVLRGRDR
jgi:hypothetical protein